ncbi:MAG: hypothetical protein RIR11_2939 [Bacteroidota bacterium]|jgi:membrane-associated protein
MEWLSQVNTSYCFTFLYLNIIPYLCGIMIELLSEALNFIRHLDEHLQNLVTEYETFTYVILALIIFCETGLVITPFLPGDSLLFAAGAVAAGSPTLNVWLLIPILIGAAIVGDNVNYFFGSYLGKKVFTRDYWFLKREYITRTEEFYEKYGGRTLVMARFVPIVRTFAPFVAGVGDMTYRRFIGFCIAGGILWVTSMTLAGYFFGQLPIIKDNFEIVVIGIIGISVLPMVFEVLRSKMKK